MRMLSNLRSHKFHMNWPLIISTSALLLLGLLAIYSEGIHKTEGSHFIKHCRVLILGIVPFFIFYKIRLNFWIEHWKLLYIINIFLLLSIYFLGHSAGGAKRWIMIGSFTFQPSELSKLITVFTLAGFFYKNQNNVQKFSTFLKSLLHISVPLFLIFKQPHLGASLVLIFTWGLMSFQFGTPLKYLIGSFTVVLVILSSAFVVPGILKDYQKERIYAMFKSDDKGSNYQQIKGIIAIGNGGIDGQGFLSGTQKEGRFVPEQHTDFIFTVIAEEFGLLGSSSVLGLFTVFFISLWRIILRAEQNYHKLIAIGCFGIVFFHLTVNMAMNLNIAPVVGLWLPFISFGGTAIWLCLSIVGTLLQIDHQEKGTLF